uniref:Uncharacterized protein n=1 Tax=Timema tahoe TaxID=61484 RepID=A0A7R9FGK9_9NEOP|nr:unnamed protein product [Timema tahoe]
MSPTDCFLRYLHLPEDDSVSVDLKQAAVALVSHLDRLAAPYLPPPSFSKTLGQCQEVLAWGWLAWSSATDAGMGPHSCEAIGELEIARVASAERCVHILTTSGKIYIVYYSSETQCPQLVEGLAGKEVVDIASHPDGKHYLALTGDGEVYTWGSGDGGRLGHGDNNSREEPTLVQALAGKHVVRVACGSTYSAAITVSGELYTWGRGNYGRLGHGSSDDYTTPTVVAALRGHRVVDVACGSGDAQTLVVTDAGLVFSWGDGDYGKLGAGCEVVSCVSHSLLMSSGRMKPRSGELGVPGKICFSPHASRRLYRVTLPPIIAGRGGSDGTKAPKLVDSLQEVDVVKVFCGAQFSLALTRAGHVYSWGKGDTHRLGHGTEEHVRFPKLVEALQGELTLICPRPSPHPHRRNYYPACVCAGKHVVSLGVGSVHVLALTEEGEVYGWGRNDYAQLMEPPTSSVARPTLLPALKGKVIIGIACGPTQSFAWSSSKNWTISLRVPFVVDVREETLRMLDQLLGQCEAVIGGDWPPPQDKECMAVACLNLLRLQVGVGPLLGLVIKLLKGGGQGGLRCLLAVSYEVHPHQQRRWGNHNVVNSGPAEIRTLTSMSPAFQSIGEPDALDSMTAGPSALGD